MMNNILSDLLVKNKWYINIILLIIVIFFTFWYLNSGVYNSFYLPDIMAKQIFHQYLSDPESPSILEGDDIVIREPGISCENTIDGFLDFRRKDMALKHIKIIKKQPLSKKAVVYYLIANIPDSYATIIKRRAEDKNIQVQARVLIFQESNRWHVSSFLLEKVYYGSSSCLKY